MKCIISEDIGSEAYQEIRKFTKNIITIRKHNDLYNAIRSHSDIQCFPLDNGVILHPKISQETIEEFKTYGVEIVFGDKVLAEKYPDNISYNAARVGDKLFHNFKYSDKKLIEECEKRSMVLVNVKQGYTRCSLLAIDSKSIITSDQGIATKARDNGIDACIIEKGNIELPGFSYGFIGGAGGVIPSEGLVLFNGDISLHPDYHKIVSFIKGKGLSYYCLSESKLKDIGSIFFIS